MTETARIQRILDGDTRQFDALVHQHYRMVYAVAFRVLERPDLAEEATQDAFLRAFQRLKQFRGQGKFSSWLYRIAYTSALEILRKEKRVPAQPAEDLESLADGVQSTVNTALEKMQAESRAALIQQALTAIRPQEKLLIDLFYLKEQSVAEIAVLTGMQKGNIKVGLHRARKKLYRILYPLVKELRSIML
ncbi:MAG: sigma-70 family RNA polymerase sigma factor [Bacteroidota bacterium]